MNPGRTIALESWRGQRLTRSLDKWSATRTWSVVGNFTKLQAIAQTGVQEGSQHNETTRLICTDIDASCEKGPTFWDVVANYGERDGGGGEPPSEDPLQRPTRIAWGRGSISVPFARDPDGALVLQYRDFPPNPPLQRQRTTRLVRLTRTLPFFPAAMDVQFEETTNKDAINIPGIGTLQPGEAAFQGLDPAGDFTATSGTVDVTCTLELRGGEQTDEDGLWDSFRVEIPYASTYGVYQGTDPPGLRLGKFRIGSEPADEPVRLKKDGTPIDPRIKVGHSHTPVAVNPPVGALLVGDDANGYVLKWQTLFAVPYAPLMSIFGR